MTARRTAIILRKARILLQELGLRPRRLKALPNLPYLVLECEMPDGLTAIDFPLNKLGRRVLREIYEHWLPGIDSGTIRLSHVLDLLLAFGPTKVVYENRSRIRRRTGLARDPKLRNFLIWRRTTATRKLRNPAPLTPAGSEIKPSSRPAGALSPYSSGRRRGDGNGL